MKGFFYYLGRIIAILALRVTMSNVNVACTWVFHQPKLPNGADKLRRF